MLRIEVEKKVMSKSYYNYVCCCIELRCGGKFFGNIHIFVGYNNITLSIFSKAIKIVTFIYIYLP